ncbi:MAG: hypothetical protein R3B99_32205 [Polyangiales bacterium]
MADEAQKRQELYEAFAGGFLAPLFGASVLEDAKARDGGLLAQITRPLPPAFLDHFELASLSKPDVEQTMLEGLHAAAGELVPTDHLRFPERGAMAIAMAAHDLFWLTDPSHDRAFARGARAKVLGFVDALIDAVPPPRTREEAIVRHVILDRLLELQREDTVVKNWAYTYRFYGRPPPGNVVAMPRLRFVRQEHTKKDLVALCYADEELGLARRLRALLSRSPVTELLRPDLAQPLVFGHATLAVLSEPTLRHGIVEALVKRSTHHVAASFGLALRRVGAEDPSPQHLYVALAFLVELQLLEVLDERVGHRPREEPAVGDEELFAAVLPALVDHAEEDGPLSFLLDLAEPDLARVVQRAELRRAQAGDDAVAFAKGMFQRAQAVASAPTVSLGAA